MGLVDLTIKWSDEGIRLPMAYDNKTGKGSVTLLASYVSMTLTVASIIGLFFSDKFIAASTASMLFFVLSIVFYELKNLSKASIDLDDRKIDLESQQPTSEGVKE